MLMEWASKNPGAAITAVLALGAALVAIVRASLRGHREYVEVSRHMDREEKQLWPEVQVLARALADFRQEQQESQATFRLEVIKMHYEHGERLAGLEVAVRTSVSETRVVARSVNGQTTELNSRLDALRGEVGLLEGALASSEKRAETLAKAAAMALRETAHVVAPRE